MDVIDGYFTVVMDFNDANAFNGAVRWLEVGVRLGNQNDPNGYTPLSPRQRITPAPYALRAESVSAPLELVASAPAGTAVLGVSSTGDGVAIGTQGKNGDIGMLGMSGVAVAGIAGSGGLAGSFDGNVNVSGTIDVDGDVIADGNVGIGTSFPSEKLTVNGGLNVDFGVLYVDDYWNRVGIGTTSVSTSGEAGLDVEGNILAKDAGNKRVAIYPLSSFGEVAMYGSNGYLNVLLSSSAAGGSDSGYAAVYDSYGLQQAGMAVDRDGDGIVWGDKKSFRIPNTALHSCSCFQSIALLKYTFVIAALTFSF
jgi:hypothetical protein